MMKPLFASIAFSIMLPTALCHAECIDRTNQAQRVSSHTQQWTADARSASLNGEWQKAIAGLENQIQSAKSQKDNASVALLSAELGSVLTDAHYFQRNQRERALDVVENSLRIAEGSCLDRAIATASLNLGRIYYRDAYATKKFEESRPYFERAHGIFQKLNDKRGTADALFFLGLIEQMQGRNAAAMSRFSESLSLAEHAKDQAQQSNAQRHIAYLNQLGGKLDAAEQGYRRSLSLREQSGFRAGIPFAIIALAEFRAEQRNDRTGAIQLLREATRVADSIPSSRGSFASHLSLGNMLAESGDAAGAKKHYQTALSAARAGGDPADISEAESAFKGLRE